MRLLSYISSTSWGGLEMNAVRYVHWFAEAGAEVKLICVADTPVYQRALELGLAVQTTTRNRKYFDWKHARALAREVNAFAPDVLWFRDNRDMDVLAWTKVFARHPFQLVYHQAMQLGVAKKDPLHTWRFRKIDTWIALLPFLAQQVETQTRFPRTRIATVPLGQEAERFSPERHTRSKARAALDLPEDAWIAGIIGRIDPLKGQLEAVRAVAALHAQGHHVQLLLMGKPTHGEGLAYVESVQAAIAQHGLQKVVHLRPYSSQVALAYRALDVFVMASAGETFGNVTVAAMLSRVAVLGTNTSGTPEILDHGKAGMLFDPQEKHGLTRALQALCTQPETVDALAEAGYQRALKHYTKQTVMDQLQKLLS